MDVPFANHFEAGKNLGQKLGREMRPAKLVVAVPVAVPETCEEFRDQADEVICAVTPEMFTAVGAWYGDVLQTSDDEVCELLARSERQHGSSALLGRGH